MKIFMLGLGVVGIIAATEVRWIYDSQITTLTYIGYATLAILAMISAGLIYGLILMKETNNVLKKVAGKDKDAG